MTVHEGEPFGVWLGRQLRRRGVSQAELAKELDVTRAAVSAWITGRAEPRLEKIELIERFLGLSSGASVTRAELSDSADSLGWYHRPAHRDGGRELGNAAAYAFDSDLAVLAREATQNSLDERFDPERPVRVRYVLHELTGERLHRFLKALRWDDLREHLHAAADPLRKTGRILRNGLQDLAEKDSLVLLRIDDYNASGLTGPEYGDGRFAAVVRRQLDSHKSTTAGGSFGLGKATLWASSRFGLVMMHSTLSETYEGQRERRLIGRLDLPWHELGDQQYAGPAWLGVPDRERDGTSRSWWADERTVEELYLSRGSDEPGTSFLVVGAYDAATEGGDLETMHENLVRGVADNFWASMIAGRDSAPMLEATVESLRNTTTVRPEERVDPHRHQPSRSRAVRAFLNGETVERITDAEAVLQKTVPLTVPPVKGRSKAFEHEAVLLVTPMENGEEERPNRLVCMRGTRMIVMDRAVGEVVGTPPFQAVLLAGLAVGESEENAAAEAFLRTAEPPDHNDWKQTDDLTATYARGAATRLREFRQAMITMTRAAARPTEGPPDEVPEALRGLLDLDPPQPNPAPKHPTVKSLTGEVRPDGAWQIRAVVRLPEGVDPWIMRPALRFGTLSGGGLPAGWAELEPEFGCEVVEGRLRFTPGARTAAFRGVSDVASHPVAANLAIAEVDLVRGESAP
ncbi:helix-turn-helix domain-containing protein [Nocardiopsis sp. CA-288880]|uniref:helix-turn-helix domain-containing protein n=1 Tax=Nocardiopsis sp. CA-288880 TaxID=3239995 RepID=UPI003D9A0041